jgi:hypothetical protein
VAWARSEKTRSAEREEHGKRLNGDYGFEINGKFVGVDR